MLRTGLLDINELITDIDNSLADDREKIGEIALAVKDIRARQDQLSARITSLDKRMKESIREAVAKATEPVIEQLEEFNKKKVLTRTINIHPLKVWWNKIKGVK